MQLKSNNVSEQNRLIDLRESQEKEVTENEHSMASALTTRTHLRLSPTLPLSDWKRIGEQILLISDSSTWWLGDWLLYGKERFPDRYRRAISETHLDYGTLRNYAWVARKFEASRRREKLSFNHHLEVAPLSVEEQDFWLDRAEERGWSKNRLRIECRAGKPLAKARQSPEQNAFRKVLLGIAIPPEKQSRWQEAAMRTERELLAWIGEMLDQAAQNVLSVSEPARPAGSGGRDESASG